MGDTDAEIIERTQSTVSCDGLNERGALGHPKVFLPLDAEGTAICPYCGRRFVQAAS